MMTGWKWTFANIKSFFQTLYAKWTNYTVNKSNQDIGVSDLVDLAS